MFMLCPKQEIGRDYAKWYELAFPSLIEVIHTRTQYTGGRSQMVEREMRKEDRGKYTHLEAVCPASHPCHSELLI